MQPAHQLRSAKCLNNHLRSEMIEKAKEKEAAAGGQTRHLSSPITAHHALVRHVGSRYAEDGARNSLGGASLLKIERLLAWGACEHTYIQGVQSCTRVEMMMMMV
jgi:hypothetical protein